MIWTALSLACRLLGLTSWAEKLLELRRIKNEAKQEVINEITAKENTALAQNIAISDRIDNLVDLDRVRDKINSRP